MTPSIKPFPQRAFHMIHVWGMLLVLLTGLALHQPPAGMNVSFLRLVHVVLGVVVLASLVARIYYAFAGRWADYRSFGLGRRQWQLLPGTLRYYMLFKGPHPSPAEGYNPLQRLTYLVVIFLLLLQSWYGLALAWPNTFSGLVAKTGGLMAIRSTHYAITWMFVAFITLHLYLVLTEARDQVRSMLLPGRSRSGVVEDAPGAGSGRGQHPVRG